MADDDENLGEGNIAQVRKHARDLERQLKEAQQRAEQAESRLAPLEEQIQGFMKAQVFDKVGVPSTGVGKLFRETYKGDLTEEAVKAAAAEYEILQPQAPIQSTPEAEAFGRMQQTLGGSTVPAPPSMVEAIKGTRNELELRDLLRAQGLIDTTQS